jgi:hypothetical protein
VSEEEEFEWSWKVDEWLQEFANLVVFAQFVNRVVFVQFVTLGVSLLVILVVFFLPVTLGAVFPSLTRPAVLEDVPRHPIQWNHVLVENDGPQTKGHREGDDPECHHRVRA